MRWPNFIGVSEACFNRQIARQDLHLVIDKINNNKILMLSCFILVIELRDDGTECNNGYCSP